MVRANRVWSCALKELLEPSTSVRRSSRHPNANGCRGCAATVAAAIDDDGADAEGWAAAPGNGQRIADMTHRRLEVTTVNRETINLKANLSSENCMGRIQMKKMKKQ